MVPSLFDKKDPQFLQTTQKESIDAINDIPSQFGFMRIMGIRKSSKGLDFHGRVLRHGYNTILQDLAHTRELFLTEQCGDFRPGVLVKPITVKIIPPGQQFVEPAEEFPEANGKISYLNYFVR